MAEIIKRLGALALTTASENKVLYAKAAGSMAAISNICICNRATVAQTYSVAHVDATGTTVANEDWIVYGAGIAANQSDFMQLGIAMSTGAEGIVVFTASTLISFSCWGSEIA